MFLEVTFTLLCLYSFALFITSLLMIVTEPKADVELYQKRVTEHVIFAIASVAVFALSVYVI